MFNDLIITKPKCNCRTCVFCRKYEDGMIFTVKAPDGLIIYCELLQEVLGLSGPSAKKYCFYYKEV